MGGSKEAYEAGVGKIHAAKREKRMADNMRRWFSHPWHMIEDGVIYTLDNVDMQKPVKQMPPRDHLRVITNEWLNHKLVAIPKSRRMMMTWLMCYLHLWLAMFHEGASVFLVSDKLDKSVDLVGQCEFILNHIPDDQMLKPNVRTKHGLLEFPGLHSSIRGIAEGENQLRQYTATALFFDEFAFWERPSESLGAARPCIDGGGRLTIVSSPLEGPYYRLCFDDTM